MIPSSAELRKRLSHHGDWDPLTPLEWAGVVRLLEVLEEVGHNYDDNVAVPRPAHVALGHDRVWADMWWQTELEMLKFLNCGHSRKMFRPNMMEGRCQKCGHAFRVNQSIFGGDRYIWET